MCFYGFHKSTICNVKFKCELSENVDKNSKVKENITTGRKPVFSEKTIHIKQANQQSFSCYNLFLV